MSIHSQNDQVILEFGLKKPAFRICVNTPTTHGSIGLTTGLDPAMTLGCGGWGGNITSDNISPRHLLNIKRLAYELRPAVTNVVASGSAGQRRARLQPGDQVRLKPDPTTTLPKAPSVPAPAGISAQTLADRIDRFLASRGYKPPDAPAPGGTVRRSADNRGVTRPHRSPRRRSCARTMCGWRCALDASWLSARRQ